MAIPQRPNVLGYHYHTYDFGGSAAFTLSGAVPNRGQFYSLVQDVNALFVNGGHVPNIAVGAVPGGAQTVGLRDTLMLSFGNLENAAACPTVVITGGIHAREWIAAEFVYLLAEYLIRNYPACLPANARVALLKQLVDTRNIHIIPMINPDGNNRTVYGLGANDRLWRKNTRQLPGNRPAWVAELTPLGPPTQPFGNVSGLPPLASYEVPDYNPAAGIPPNLGAANYRRHNLAENETGVDGNRNMPSPAWGYDSGPDYDDSEPQSDTYFGAGPGGERETSNVQVAMAAAAAGGVGGNIAVSIDYHSYGRMILYPDEMPIGGPTPNYQLTGQLLRALIVDNANQRYQLGGGIGYLSTGTVDNYSVQTHQARAFTIELDPAANDPAEFELPENQIQPVFETNIRGALAAIAAPTGLASVLAVTNAFAPWAVHGAGNQVP